MVVTIANPNPFPVTMTAVQLPTNVTYATGYTTSALTTTQTGCLAATPSAVTWNNSTATSGSSHTLTTALTAGASGQSNNPLVVTLRRLDQLIGPPERVTVSPVRRAGHPAGNRDRPSDEGARSEWDPGRHPYCREGQS